MNEWQPIDTAPKDTAVLTFRGVGLMAVAENIVHPRHFPKQTPRIWCCTDGVFLLNVTHWMPLPHPPSVDAGATNLESGKAESAQDSSSSSVVL